MRRWVWRGTLAVVAVGLLLSSAVGVKGFNRACDGSLEGLRYLSNVRAQLASATAPAPTPVPTTPTTVPPTPTARPTTNGAQPPTPTLAPTPTPTQAPTPAPPSVGQRVLEEAGVVGDRALVALVQIKQNDAVAYPAHIMAAHTLSAAGCGKDAVRLQWLKAGLHASGAGQPEHIAGALRASTTDADDLTDLGRVVRAWTERASLNVSLRRVRDTLDASAS